MSGLRGWVLVALAGWLAACELEAETPEPVPEGGAGAGGHAGDAGSPDPRRDGGGAAGEDGGSPDASPQAPRTDFVSGDLRWEGTGGDTEGWGDHASTAVDVTQRVDDRLYTLTASALVIVDAADPDRLTRLGQHSLRGPPVDVHVRDGIAYVTLDGFQQWDWDPQLGQQVSRTARIVALDVRDPAAIVERGEVILPGGEVASVVAGDVLYAATACGSCSELERDGALTAIRLGDPAGLRAGDQIAIADLWRSPTLLAAGERLFVTGGVAESVDVIDISEPTGRLVSAGRLAIDGGVFRSTQMQTQGDQFRVVSRGQATGAPSVAIFRAGPGGNYARAGYLSLGSRELYDARFDGDRVYAAVRSDAGDTVELHVVDLSDPTAPVRRGAVAPGGWLRHFEPAGDRLLALAEGPRDQPGLALSLFDVADPAAPRLLDRVAFGADGAASGIVSALLPLPEAGLVAVGYSGPDYPDDWECPGRYPSGLQVVEWLGDTLSLGPALPHDGFARQAFYLRDRLVAVSTERAEAFRLAGGGAPASTAVLPLTRIPLRFAADGDRPARLSFDRWTGAAALDVWSDEGLTGDAPPLGTLELAEPTADSCDFGAEPIHLYGHGNHAWLLWPGYLDAGRIQIAVVDLTDPRHPLLVGRARLPVEFPFGAPGWEDLAQIGQPTLARDGTLLLASTDGIAVVDLRDPAAPRLAGRIPLPREELGGLVELAGEAYAIRVVPVSDSSPAAAFHLDRLDVSDPDRPVVRSSINIPGTPLRLDGARLVTVENALCEERASAGMGCPPFHRRVLDCFDGVCLRTGRVLNLLELRGDGAVVLDRLAFDDAQVRDVRAAVGRIYVTLDGSTWQDPPDRDFDPRRRLLNVLVQEDRFAVAGETRLREEYAGLLAIHGDRAVVLTAWPPLVSIYEAGPGGAPRLVREVPLSSLGWFHSAVRGGRLLIAGVSGSTDVVPLD